MAVTPDAFKEALARWASGVSVVTANDDGMLYGLTVSSFSSLSLTPPLVLVCLSSGNRLVEMIQRGGRFAVSILAADQEAASNYFAKSGRLPTPGFTEIEGEWAPTGVPVVAGALAWLSCGLDQMLVQGDHTVVIGQVEATGHSAKEAPLLYFGRGYRRLG